MAGELEKTVREYMKRVDAKDFAGVGRMLTDDVQTVDEISRRWLRGRQAVEEYFRQVGPAVEDIRSELTDVREAVWGDTGMVTCWMEQDYTYQGKRQHVAAPTTIVLRRVGSEWKAALHHSVPLPESA
jgi:ketosteroid isomerase-like protein